MVVYTALYSFFCIQRWDTAYLGDPDYGLFNQSFWTTTQKGWLFYNTYEGGSHFQTHNSPIFFLLLPFYALVPRMETLLVVQAAAVALGALAVFKLTRYLLDEESGVTLAIAYLFYHPLHGVNYDQFNELSFLPAPLLFAFYNLYRRRMAWFWLCILLALGCKEDVPFVTFMVGLYIVWLGLSSTRPEGRRDPLVLHGAALAAVSILWLSFSLFVLFPYMRGGHDWPYFRERYGHFGTSFSEVVLTLLLRPWLMLPYLFGLHTIMFFVELVAPLAFLPLLAPRILLLALPTWIILQLSSFGAMHNAGSRYMAPVVSCLFVAVAVGVRQRVAPALLFDEIAPLSDAGRARAHKLLRWALILTILFTLAIDTTPMRFPFKNIPRLDSHQRARNSLVSFLPPDASVSTQPEFFGKVSSRVSAYMGYHAGTEYILVDPTQPLWYNHAHWDQVLPGLVASKQYLVVKEADGALLLKKNPSGH